MANYISKINIAGVVYDIYDKEARDLLAKTLVFVGVTTTAVSDGATTPATYGGLAGITIPPGHTGADTLDAGTVVIYNQKEFVWDGAKWAEFGDLSDLSLSTTTGNFVTGVTATPTNTATNTGAGTAHSHTMGGTTKYIGLAGNTIGLYKGSQSASIVETVATGTLSTTSGAGKGDGVVASLTTQKLVTDTVTNWTAATAKNVATTGTAVAVFNSITSTQGADGIKVITDVSGGGQTGEVTTVGVAASVAPNVVTGWMTHATGSGLGNPIKYFYSLNDSNKLITSQFTPVAVGTAFSYIDGYSSTASLTGNQIPFLANATPYTSQTLGSVNQWTSSNSDGTNTNTLYLLTKAATGYIESGSGWGMSQAVFPTFTTSYLTFASATPAVAGTTAITYATGSVGTAGSGSTVVTGGSSQYLGYTSVSQTTNTPTVVSFGTVVINGTPSYIHTSNIIPAVANGTIVGLNTSATKTFATGSTATNGSGSTVAIGGTTKYMNLDTQSITLETTPVTSLTMEGLPISSFTLPAQLSISDTLPMPGWQSFIQKLDATTGQESAHTHSYSKATAISISAPTASAITSVSLTPAS